MLANRIPVLDDWMNDDDENAATYRKKSILAHVAVTNCPGLDRFNKWEFVSDSCYKGSSSRSACHCGRF